MPKWPRSSGPVRKELGCCGMFMRSSYRRSGDVRSARGADEGADLVRVLHAGRAFDAGRHIDAASTRDAQRFRHIAGIDPARKHERNRYVEFLQKVPVEWL